MVSPGLQVTSGGVQRAQRPVFGHDKFPRQQLLPPLFFSSSSTLTVFGSQ